MTLNPWLSLTLLVTLALSTWALLVPLPNEPAAPVASRPVDPLGHALPPVGRGPDRGLQTERLPARLMAPEWEAAQNDPFEAPARSSPEVPATTSPLPVPTAAAMPAPAAPAEPPFEHTFFGRMTTPDGTGLVLLSGSSGVVVASVGAALDNGYVVESLDANAVHALHSQLRVRRMIAIIPAP